MSGPHQNYGGQPGGYQAPYPGQQLTYNDHNAYGTGPQPQYQQQQGYGAQDFGPPHRQDSYGPPQHGGFQHGQQGGQYGQYDASNPQGNPTYYGAGYNQPQTQQYQNQQPYGAQPNDAFAANQAYQSNMGQSHQQAGGYTAEQAQNHQFAKQSSDPNAPNYDPSAPPMTESDRGLLGALGGGFAGHHFGGKAGHGFLGTVGGAILGSFAEDFMKGQKNKHSSSSQNNSSWGGGSKW